MLIPAMQEKSALCFIQPAAVKQRPRELAFLTGPPGGKLYVFRVHAGQFAGRALFCRPHPQPLQADHRLDAAAFLQLQSLRMIQETE